MLENRHLFYFPLLQNIMLQEDGHMEQFHSIHKNKLRIEAWHKADGKAVYGDDIEMDGMLFAYGVASSHVSARITGIEVSAAEQAEGVRCVLTHKDIPGDKMMGEDIQDQYILAVDRVLFQGDIVAVVVADTLENARRAGKLVKVDYEPLKPLTDLYEAMNSGTAVNPTRKDNICSSCFIRKGDAEKALRESDVVLTTRYDTTWQEHAYLEPEALVAYPGRSGREVTVIGSMQSLYMPRLSIHRSLKIPMSRITVAAAAIGGSFGGKLESPEVLAVRAALAALRTGRPVKYVLTREESITQSYKRHPFHFDIKLSAEKDGRITAFTAGSVAASGCYANMSPGIIFKAVSLGAGPYAIPNVSIDSKAVYTNNVPTGSMRGFGNPQGIYARECAFDEMAAVLGVSRSVFRKRNVMHTGDTIGSNQLIDFETVGAEQVLDQVAEALDFEKKYWQFKRENPGKSVRRGVGLSLSYRGNSYGTGVEDISRAYVEVERDGSVLLSIGLAEIGQGLNTVMTQLAAEALCVSDEAVTISESNTGAPLTGTCNASRGTLMGGNAIRDAAGKIHAVIRESVAEKTGCSPDEITFTTEQVHAAGKTLSFQQAVEITYASGRTPAFVGTYKVPDLNFNAETGEGDIFYEYTYSCIGAEVEIDTCTGQSKVIRTVSAHDIGRAINPKLAQGQIIGGSVMAQGYAFMEDIWLKNGIIGHDNLDDYMIPGIMDVNCVEPILVENPNERGPYGARSLGEPTFAPGLGAYINAVNCALGELGRIRSAPADLKNVLFHTKRPD
jgi:CO/xanthine dehydrogenase Mo-binding subunit